MMQSGAPREVVLVEDSDTDSLLIEHFLKASTGPGGARYQVRRFDNIADAVTALRERRPSVILLDLHVPGHSGLETFERFREFATDVPIVGLTSSDDEQLPYRLLEEGGQDFLRKDHVNKWTLVHAVEFALNRHAIQTQLRHLMEAESDSGRDFRAIVEGTSACLIVTDLEFKVLYANTEGCALLQGTPDNLLGRQLDLYRDQEAAVDFLDSPGGKRQVDAAKIQWDGADGVLITVLPEAVGAPA